MLFTGPKYIFRYVCGNRKDIQIPLLCKKCLMLNSLQIQSCIFAGINMCDVAKYIFIIFTYFHLHYFCYVPLSCIHNPWNVSCLKYGYYSIYAYQDGYIYVYVV